ncbi:MAG TPA: efflux RND transporter periplasmic adaptor subunit [Mesorhizobium sp.]|jgi:multidrug efflux system membrane fusion protein|uniref:efflux RND transporter periplasmic adaptor subunit n=1 Tax=Mesorhizobium sp. TaxID=1871066 RepID=UPI002DDCB023|nr:efflux RND transporter periplasmic adaptor subunit [Mesorhizobium sp.]HEV2501937.1 efflux RND transporter periplasmic adaptor subunit [Mesorhizobium sp.]
MRPWKITTAVAVIAAAATYVHFNGEPAFLSGLISKPADAAAPAQAMQAMPVPVAAVVKKTLPVYLDYTARAEAIRSVALQAKVSGYILEQAAEDGVDVKKGDTLYRIDPRDYQVALDQVKAQAQRNQASLSYTKASLTRGNDLIKTGFLSKDGFDQRSSTMQQGEASVAADNAAIQAAEINLGYTTIRAPFDGRLGRNQAPVGTLVNVGGTSLNTLVQVSPVYVTFTPSEGDLALIQKAKSNGPIVAEVTIPGDKGAPRKGELTFIDNKIDTATGTIVARATIANEDRSLLPGQYVNIRLQIGETPNTLLIPQVALGSNQLGKFVYVIDEGNKVGMRLVELGQTEGELIAITKGITENDKIISGNLQKIGPGMPVNPQTASPTPPPAS